MKHIYIDAAHQEETRVVLLDQSGRVSDFDIETTTKPQIKGNVYLGKVIRIEPSLQAAFVDYGSGKNGFLPFSEIHPDYYQIDAEKKKRLLELAHANIVEDDDDSEDGDMVEYDDESAGEDNKELTRRAQEFKIQDVIRQKQIILVQGVKEERGNKGASMTTFMSLSGRFAVLMPNSRKRNGYGISKKIGDKAERVRLRKILHKLKIPRGMTFVLRTAAMGASASEIEADYDFLTGEWNDIRKKTMESIAPATIHAEDSLLKRVARDFVIDPADTMITVEGDGAFGEVAQYYQQFHGKKPDKKQLELYDDPQQPLFAKHGIERQLEGLHGPYVDLPSGGQLVINQTEAMVTIDVNSSKSITAKDIEQTALNTNLEAADEIGLQLRLRDLAGIIAIDFIDMEEEKNNRRLEAKMREVMRRDRARSQILKINGFGVMLLSRQRMRSSFIESSYLQCPYCGGAGVVPSIQTAALIMFRRLQDKIVARNAEKIVMNVPSDVAVYLLNQKRFEIAALERESGTEIAIIGDDSIMNIADSAVHRIGKETSSDELLGAHLPSTDSCKPNAARKSVRQAVVDTKNRNVKPALRRRSPARLDRARVALVKKAKRKSFWKKLVG
ncbi:MAG: Rne/Rng family ribonuclease [Rickettsiales bacterium]|jgi:ribonuclease E|nr:Rne/Rng family ribonuclease [Rickettsiales bacterium]